ncbi:MAG: aminotransferase class I/II-fold pyridoxal phosphate-dependent enzyme [Halioglobus sp.]|nr:aminotransferase class I/II-fold pyridoxal phosphate-dependent enzyme [Halioglobus sp.]
MTLNTHGKIFQIGRPNVGDRERMKLRLDEILANNYLTNNGPLVQELEDKLARYCGVKHCIAMSNGTVALELAIRATDLQDEVIVPSMTFIATAHALQWQGIRPLFADIDNTTLNICPASVEKLITPRTTGIIGVHLYGRPCDIEGLQRIADEHGLKLLFDSAHAFGSSHNGMRVGNFGDCEAFSFHATKVFNTFEGGAVTTNDDELARKLRLMRNFGFEGEDNVSYIGTNGKMSEICAAMGLTNLESLDGFIAINKENYSRYRDELCGIEGISLEPYNADEESNYQYVILRVDSARFGKSRDALKSKLESEGIMARRYFYPGCHRMQPYRSLYPGLGSSLPVTESFSEEVLALPNGKQITPEEVSWVCQLIRAFGSES